MSNTQPLIEIKSPDDCPCAVWEQDGFTLKLSSMVDPFPDLSNLGHFSRERKFGAIAHEDAKRDANLLPYFVPANSALTVQRQLQKDGLTKADASAAAKKQVEEDYQRAKSYGDSWCMYDFCVTASLNDVILGRAILGSVESDCDESHFIQIAQDLGQDAISEAKQKLEQLAQFHAQLLTQD